MTPRYLPWVVLALALVALRGVLRGLSARDPKANKLTPPGQGEAGPTPSTAVPSTSFVPPLVDPGGVEKRVALPASRVGLRRAAVEARSQSIAVCGGTIAPIEGYTIYDAQTCDEAYGRTVDWVVEIFGQEVIDVKDHLEDGYCGHGWGVVKEGRVVCPRSPTTTPPQQTHGYEQIHQLLHSSDRNRCTKTHVLKGENANEPDVHICLDAIPNSGCVVYSIGIANNWIFDDFMIEQGCQVFSFDPSMTGVKKHKRHAAHLFEPIGIGTSDGTHTGESTLYGKKTNYPVETLGHMMDRHGHTHLTMVRMDVESAEWDVLEQWVSKGWIERMDQLLLEIHMWKHVDEKRHSELMHSIPMELFHTAKNHWDGTRLHGDMTRVHEMGWLKELPPPPSPPPPPPPQYISRWLESLHRAFDASPLAKELSLIRQELDCSPHYPRYNDFNGNMRGSREMCLRGGMRCGGNKRQPSLWINTESIFRNQELGWSSCDRAANEWRAAAVFGLQREKWKDIPIPTHTYPHTGYPSSAVENQARCDRAKYDAVFKGHHGNKNWGKEREMLKAFASTNGFKIEFNNGMGQRSERMAELLHDSRFGFAPAGDGWHSYRLMETMAMGVVPIILSDEWALPFEDILDWTEFSIRVSIDDIPKLPSIVAEHRDRACDMSRRVFEVYHRYMANATQIMKGIEATMRRADFRRSDKTALTLVSWLASNWSNAGYEAMLANRKAYAQKHGYRFLDFNETNLPTDELRRDWRRLSHFIKPPLLRAAMDNISPNDWLVWMDADSLFTNDTIEWSPMLDKDVVFAEAHDVVANNGVFAVRSTVWGRGFLELWDEECAASPGPSVDNGPFVHALLRAFASTHNVPYNNECRANSWGRLMSCYNKHIQRISDASGLPRTIGPNGEIGSGLVGDPHITGAWGINSGIGFKPPNDWHEGDFILHFAGQSATNRKRNALKYTKLVQ